MADVPNGGRIVPIVSPARQQHQMYSLPSPPAEPDDQPRHSQLSQSLPTSSTRPKPDDPACLKLPCLTELGLYALPTEGDGKCPRVP